MIYTVECNFADPAQETAWDAFYSLEKLPALLSVTGFHTSQRFQAISSGCPAYLALHTIENFDVLLSDEYHLKGGGNFARWQGLITAWRRNFYTGLERAPAIATDAFLLLTERGPNTLIELGLTPYPLQAVALDKAPARRWLASATGPVARFSERNDLYVYRAITEQLQAGGAPR